MGLTERLSLRPTGKILIAVLLLAGLAAGLNAGLRACTTRNPDGSRPLNSEELSRLATMRQRNFTEGRVGIRGLAGQQGAQSSINGWIDWSRSLIYLAVSSHVHGSVALVQARPGLLAIRPNQPARESASPSLPPALASPPRPAPADGWRVRPIVLADKEKTPLDELIAFLFVIARDRPDRQDLLSRLSTQWVRKDIAQGTDVDVLLGPAVLPEAEPSPSPAAASPSPLTASQGTPIAHPSTLDIPDDTVGYWLDSAGRLRKVEAVLGASLPATLEFVRDDRTEIRAIDALGGRDIDPRAVTDPEAQMLSLMRQRNFHARRAHLSLTLPMMPGTLRTGTGWLDWQRGVSYLSIVDADDPAGDIVVHASRSHIAKRKPDSRGAQMPPLPAPKGNWERDAWSDLRRGPEFTDVDMLLYEVISMASHQRDDAKGLKSRARLLRVDMLLGSPVGVFELPKVFEQEAAPGTARLRYWLDNFGVLRRLEIRTGTGGFAQLDIAVGGSVPYLPSSVQ